MYQLPSCIGSEMSDLMHVFYYAKKPWSQLCYFTGFDITERLVNCTEWLNNGLSLFLEKPLIFIDRTGKEYYLFEERKVKKELFNKVILRGTEWYEDFKPRTLTLYPASSTLIQITKASLVLKKAQLEVSGRESFKKENDMASFFDNRGKITSLGKKKIQQIGRDFPRASGEDIVKLLPPSLRRLPLSSISAHIAVGRRKPKK